MVRGWIRGFCLAFGAKAALTLLFTIVRGTRGKGLRTKLVDMLQNFGITRDSARFGVFFGSLIGCFKGTNCALRFLRGRDDTLNRYIAGCILIGNFFFLPPSLGTEAWILL